MGLITIGSEAHDVVGEQDCQDANRNGYDRSDEPLAPAGAVFQVLQPMLQCLVEVLVQDTGGLLVDRGEFLHVGRSFCRFGDLAFDVFEENGTHAQFRLKLFHQPRSLLQDFGSAFRAFGKALGPELCQFFTTGLQVAPTLPKAKPGKDVKTYSYTDKQCPGRDVFGARSQRSIVRIRMAEGRRINGRINCAAVKEDGTEDECNEADQPYGRSRVPFVSISLRFSNVQIARYEDPLTVCSHGSVSQLIR